MDEVLWATMHLALVIFSLTVGLEFFLRKELGKKGSISMQIFSFSSLIVVVALILVLTGLEMALISVVGMRLENVLYDVASYVVYYLSGAVLGITIRFVEKRGIPKRKEYIKGLLLWISIFLVLFILIYVSIMYNL